MKTSSLELLREVLVLPTAPFREGAVVAFVRNWAKERKLKLESDDAGNLFIRYKKGKPAGARWFFTAHMDHPGFVATKRRGRTVWAHFRGGVRLEYFSGARMRFFTEAGEVDGTVETAVVDKKLGWLRCRIRMDEPAPVKAGTVGMWAFPGVRVRGSRVYARACDDLAGLASILATLDELCRRKAVADVTALFTRAEEVGFIGCLAACKRQSVPKNSYVVSIETSSVTPSARLGDGVIIRAGDRTSIFDAELTMYLTALARGIFANEKGFRFKQQIMPGGTCESTAFCAFGYQATGLCIPLGNYHNMGPKARVRPEIVSADDYGSLVRLLVAIAEMPSSPRVLSPGMRKKLEASLKQREAYLKPV